MIGAVDGRAVKGVRTVTAAEGETAGAELAAALLASGGRRWPENTMLMKRTEIANGSSLMGKRIACDACREQASDLVEKLRSLGEGLDCPAIAIAPLEDFTVLDEVIRDLAQYDWVIFTSVNGVDALLERLSKKGVGLNALSKSKVAAIGPATARALERAGRTPDFVPGSYIAEAIIEEIGDVQNCRVLLPRADIARKALAEGLRLRGASVTEVAVYRTVPGVGNRS